MRLIENLERIANGIEQLSSDARQRPSADGELFSQFAKRLADVEARLQKIESLLLTRTVAGKPKLTDEGKRVGDLWYQKQ